MPQLQPHRRHRHHTLTLAVINALGTLAVLSSPSAQAAPESETSLGEIVVQAGRSPARAANQVDALPARRAASSDTASLLRDQPGVSLYGAGGVSSLPTIHGLADDRLRIKVDGMDLLASCPNHMNPALSYLDPSNVSSLQVYPGVTPVSVGGDSIGGSIIASSPAPRFAAPGAAPLVSGEAGGFYRSNGNARGANVAASYATDSLSLSYAGSTAEADNYKAGGNFKNYDFTGRPGHTTGRNEVASTAYQSRNHNLGLALKGGNHLLEAKLGYQDIPYQLYPNQRMDLLGNTQHRANLRYLGDFDWGRLEARAYHEKTDHFMDFGADKRYWYGTASGGSTALNGNPCSPLGSTCAAGMPMYTRGKTSGLSLKGDLPLSAEDLLRLGGEWQQYRLDDWWPASGGGMWPGTFSNINNGQRDRQALFAEWESVRSPQWTTLAGLRYEHVRSDAGTVQGYNPAGGGNQGRDASAFNNSDRRRTDHNWDASLLARYQHSSTLDIDLGLARKVRSPNLYERYSWSTWQMAALMNNFVGDGNGYLGDPNLKPEKAHTLSATIDWHDAERDWELKATPYYTRVTDYIDAVQWNATTNAPQTTLLKNQFTVLRYTNQSARLYGLDLAGRLPLGHSAIGELGLKGLLNLSSGKNRDTGDELYNIMPANAKLTLTQRQGGWDNAIELVLVKAKDQVSDVRNEIKTPGYSLINLRGSYSWQQTRIDFGIDNLFDRHYFLPLGGAYTGQGTTMSNPALPNYPQWGTAVPGMGRSVYAGVNVRF